MAIPGNGSRTANSVLIEISCHLVCPFVTRNLGILVAPGVHTISGPTDAMYNGALLVCDTGSSAEVIAISNVTANSFTATFTKSHFSNAPLLTATFPLQAETDPVFTQSEMLGYLSRAQNEFLERVPCIMAIFEQAAVPGVIPQVLPSLAIELNRVAASNKALPIVSLARSGNVVTAVFVDPHGLSAKQTFLVKDAGDPTFDGAFAVTTVVGPKSITYNQVAPNASTTGGTLQYLVRLYEVTQQELTMANRQWRQTPGFPTSFFEDRSGVYGWGLGALPAFGIPLELLCSIRDTDTLGLLDHFLVPDVAIHGVKYLALAYAFSKDSVFADSQRAAYCQQRFERVVLALERFIDNMMGGRNG